jgi:uncharacterized caspase-like protein
MMARAAVTIGIDDYKSAKPLDGCERDAERLSLLLGRHHDDAPNFHVDMYLGSRVSLGRAVLRGLARDLFKATGLEVALFYFAGHGELTERGGQLVAYDGETDDEGIAMRELVELANASDARERIIILDCCHAGAIDMAAASRLPLAEGVSILAAARADEAAKEINARGLFTSRLCEALEGGAADVVGDVTIASLYDYVDQMFKPLEQRPLLKANISKLVPLRRAKPAIAPGILRKIVDHFPTPDYDFRLDPSYEPTAEPPHEAHEAIFGELQAYQAVRLLAPVGTRFMYYAAVERHSCQLTPLGHFYWHRVKAGKL